MTVLKREIRTRQRRGPQPPEPDRAFWSLALTVRFCRLIFLWICRPFMAAFTRAAAAGDGNGNGDGDGVIGSSSSSSHPPPSSMVSKPSLSMLSILLIDCALITCVFKHGITNAYVLDFLTMFLSSLSLPPPVSINQLRKNEAFFPLKLFAPLHFWLLSSGPGIKCRNLSLNLV